LISEYHKDIT